MIHLKRFNEEVGNPKLLDFYNEYKNLFEGEYDSGDLYDTVGDLCVQHEMTRQEVRQILDTFDCSFDDDNLLEATYDNWTDIEIGASDGSDSKLYTRNEVIKIIQDFYIHKNKWDYNNDQPNKLNIDHMNKEVENWMKDK